MYSITVKIEGMESRRRGAGLFHAIIGFYLLAKSAEYYQRYLQYDSLLPVLPLFALALFSVAYGFFRRRIDPAARFHAFLRLAQVIGLTALGIALSRTGRPLEYLGLLFFAAVTILLLFSERKIFQGTTIELRRDGILVPGSYRDHQLPWLALSEVVVREDFLTIFHKKKKYLQFQVRQDLSVPELAEMNAFCREQIQRAAVTAEA